MNSTPDVGQKADADEVRALLRELSQQLLAWSWEGVVGYEEMVERVGRRRHGSAARDDQARGG